MHFPMKTLFAFFLVSALFIGTVSASWAYLFVVFDGNIYAISEERIDPEQIGSRIGKVTVYSDREGTYAGNFSNRYPKGTEYYEIHGVEISDAIAVKEAERLYVKADYRGEYAGGRYSWPNMVPYVTAVLLVVVLAYIIKKRIRR